MKRVYRAAYCIDGWQTIEEYDDCVAVLRGRSLEYTRVTRGNGRPPKYATLEEEARARQDAQRRYKQRKAG